MDRKLGGLAAVILALSGCATMSPQKATVTSTYELCWIVATGQSADGWVFYDSQDRYAAEAEVRRRGDSCGNYQQQIATAQQQRADAWRAVGEAGAKMSEQAAQQQPPPPAAPTQTVCQTMANGMTYCRTY